MNRKWVVASRPEVEVQAHNFELKQEPVPLSFYPAPCW